MGFIGSGQFALAEYLPKAPEELLSETQLTEMSNRDPLLGVLVQDLFNVRQFCKQLVSNLFEYSEMMHNSTGVGGSDGFTSATDGTNTQSASESAVLHFKDGTYATVAYVTGDLWFVVDIANEGAANNVNNSTGTTRITAGKIIIEDFIVEAAGASPPGTTYPGMLWKVTSTSGSYLQGEIYRRNDADDGWDKYEDALYSTTITAGKIVLSSSTNDIIVRASGGSPPAHLVGKLWYVTDTAGEPTYVQHNVYRSTGSAWELYASEGATWGSNLYSIPLRFSESPSTQSLYLTASAIGFYNGDDWTVFIDGTNGYLHLKDASGEIVIEPGDGVWFKDIGDGLGQTLALASYNTTTSSTGCSKLFYYKNRQNTDSGHTTTITTEFIGYTAFYGVNAAGNAYAIGAEFYVTQMGDADAATVPATFTLTTRDDDATIHTWTFSYAGATICPGSLSIGGTLDLNSNAITEVGSIDMLGNIDCNTYKVIDAHLEGCRISGINYDTINAGAIRYQSNNYYFMGSIGTDLYRSFALLSQAPANGDLYQSTGSSQLYPISKGTEGEILSIYQNIITWTSSLKNCLCSTKFGLKSATAAVIKAWSGCQPGDIAFCNNVGATPATGRVVYFDTDSPGVWRKINGEGAI